jgi:hypothetical protein
MIELVSEKVWESLREVTWPGPVRAAIAYVGREAPDLLPLKSGDTLVFDGSDDSLTAGSTHPKAIQDLLDRGVRLWSLDHLHAKMIVAGAEEGGERKALVGSANASTRSRTTLREAALLTDDADVAAQVDRQIDEWLKDRAVRRVDRAWIERAVTLHLLRRGPISPRTGGQWHELDRRLWIAPWTNDDRPLFSAEKDALEFARRRHPDRLVETYRLPDWGYDIAPGDDLMFYERGDRPVPAPNRSSSPVAMVDQVVVHPGRHMCVAICVSPREGPRMTYAHLRRTVEAESDDVTEKGPLSPRSARAVRQALAALERHAVAAIDKEDA